MKYFLLAITSTALFFTLPPYMEFCFSLDGKVSKKIRGDYVISGENDMAVLTRAFDSQRIAKYTSPKNTREGKFEMTPDKDGTCEICFKCLDSDEKSISFDFFQEDDVDRTQPTYDNEFHTFNLKIETLLNSLGDIYRNLHFYERRESVHRDLAEKTCDNILWSVLIKIFVLCALSLTQIYALRGFISLEKTAV